jgi:hypothetical protein
MTTLPLFIRKGEKENLLIDGYMPRNLAIIINGKKGDMRY